MNPAEAEKLILKHAEDFRTLLGKQDALAWFDGDNGLFAPGYHDRWRLLGPNHDTVLLLPLAAALCAFIEFWRDRLEKEHGAVMGAHLYGGYSLFGAGNTWPVFPTILEAICAAVAALAKEKREKEKPAPAPAPAPSPASDCGPWHPTPLELPPSGELVLGYWRGGLVAPARRGGSTWAVALRSGEGAPDWWMPLPAGPTEQPAPPAATEKPTPSEAAMRAAYAIRKIGCTTRDPENAAAIIDEAILEANQGYRLEFLKDRIHVVPPQVPYGMKIVGEATP